MNNITTALRHPVRICKKYKRHLIAGTGIFLFGGLFVLGVFYGWYMHRYNTEAYEHIGRWPLPRKKDIPLWERKVPVDDAMIKIGMITDTQVHPSRVYRWGSTLNRYLKKSYTDVFENYKAEMQKFQPAFTIHLGDIIEGTGDPLVVGEIGLRLVKEGLEIPGIPMYWVLGNHDLRSVARRQFQEALEIDYVNHVVDDGPYRFIIFDANYRKSGVPQNPIAGDYIPGFVSKENLAWLEKQLQTDKRVFIFMHQSLVPQEDIAKGTIANAPEVRKLLAHYNVEAVFDGHVERRYFGTFDGVDYYAFPGTKKSPRYPGAYYTMTLHGTEPEIMMFFTDPITGEATAQPFIKDDEMERGYRVRQQKATMQNREQLSGDDLKEEEEDADDGEEQEEKETACEVTAECDFDDLCVDHVCQDITVLRMEAQHATRL